MWNVQRIVTHWLWYLLPTHWPLEEPTWGIWSQCFVGVGADGVTMMVQMLISIMLLLLLVGEIGLHSFLMTLHIDRYLRMVMLKITKSPL